MASTNAPAAGSDNGYVIYRVWPDGTLQSVEEGAPYPWMSDDFVLISAADEASALELASARESIALQPRNLNH